jgi:signal transduction histidine kinase
VFVVILALATVGTVLTVVNGSEGDPVENALFGGVFLVTAAIGVLIAVRRSENTVGWLLIGSVGAIVVAFGVDQYARYALLTRQDAPFGAWAAWYSGWGWVVGFGPLLTFLPLLFPDGHLPSRRWRPVGWFAFASVVALPLVVAFDPELDSGFDVANPVAWDAAEPVLGVLGALGWPAFLLSALACVASLFVRYRGTSSQQRQQIKLVLVGFAFILGWFVFEGVVELADLGIPDWLGNAISAAGFLSIPVSMGIAILKYRLFDIEVVIKRAVVFGVLAVVVTAVYVAVVYGVGALFFGAGEGGPNALAFVAAALVALVFQPVRAAARRLADRVVYGKRATPYEVLSDFAGRMGGTYSTEDVLPRMAQLITAGTGATRAEIWLRVGDELRVEARWPEGNGDRPPAVRLPTGGTDLPALPGIDEALPVVHQGQLLGAIAVAVSASEPLSATQRQLLEDLAAQAGLVLRNVGLTADLRARLEDLRASRERLVTAQDAERRRLERNIHDGAQQQLVAMAVRLRLAEQLTERDPSRARAMLGQLQDEARSALEDLRDLARGIYPPLLADRGLPEALEAQARKATLPVSVAVEGAGARYPQEAEAAVYFCVLEALQNVAKYADASAAAIRLRCEPDELAFEIRDDGRGFDAGVTGYGTGLQGMADRLDALGGALRVESAPERGTAVIGRVPARARAEATT